MKVPDLRHYELIDEGLADSDMRLVQSADAVHAVRQQDPVPVYGRMLGQLVRYENAHLVALDALDRRPWRLSVVAPQVRIHARRKLAPHRLGDQVKFLPAVIHAPWQAPPVEGHDRLIRPPGRGFERRLRIRLGLDRAPPERRPALLCSPRRPPAWRLRMRARKFRRVVIRASNSGASLPDSTRITVSLRAIGVFTTARMKRECVFHKSPSCGRSVFGRASATGASASQSLG